MARLGQYLCERGLIGPEQLEEALQHQVIHGARLGTNLVELRMLSVEQLAQVLSEFHGVPLPPRRWIERPARNAVEVVTRTLVERMRFIPMRLSGKVLHAAVLDPRDPGVLDDLRFATGCRIEPYVLPELWMHDWLEQLFRVQRGVRFVDTRGPQVVGEDEERAPPPARGQAAVARGSEARRPFEPSKPAAQPAGVATKAAAAASQPNATPADTVRQRPIERSGVGFGFDDEPDQVIDVPPPTASRERTLAQASAPEPARSVRPPAERTVPVDGIVAPARPTLPAAPLLPTPPPPKPPPSAAAATASGDGPGFAPPLAHAATMVQPPLAASSGASLASLVSLAELEREMLEAATRDRVIELGLQLARCFAARVALFSVHQGTIQGMRAVSERGDVAIDGVLVPLHADSMLAEVALRAEATRVKPAERAIDTRILALLGEARVPEALLVPVLIKHRVINLLYADNAEAQLALTSGGALTVLAEQMSRAYELLILRRKGS